MIKVADEWEWRRDETNDEFGWHSRLDGNPTLPFPSEFIGGETTARNVRMQLQTRRKIDDVLEEDEQG